MPIADPQDWLELEGDGMLSAEDQAALIIVARLRDGVVREEILVNADGSCIFRRRSWSGDSGIEDRWFICRWSSHASAAR